MSLVTTARLVRGQNCRESWSTSAVLPEPTGPATPTRYALGTSLGSIALASSALRVARFAIPTLRSIPVKYATDAGSVKQCLRARNNSAGRVAGLAQIFVLQRQRADPTWNSRFFAGARTREE